MEINLRQVRTSNLPAFFPKKVSLLIIFPKKILSQNCEIPTSKTGAITINTDITIISSYFLKTVFQPDKDEKIPLNALNSISYCYEVVWEFFY